MSAMNSVELSELQIAYDRKGSGPPLVLLHGGLADHRAWRSQIDVLADAYTVIAWDAPGCGQSSDPPESFLLSDFADCLAGLMRQLETGPAHILGLSFGGGLALEFYRHHASLTRSLILAGAYAGWAGSLPAEEVEDRLRKGIQQSEQEPSTVAEEWIPTLFSEDVSEDVAEETAAMLADFHPAGMRAGLRAFAKADLRDVLPRIEVPTLLIYGERDERSPQRVARELNNAITGSELVFIPRAGHVVNAEAPDAFNNEVRRFLNKL